MAGDQVAYGLGGDVGARSQNETATPRCARRSAVWDKLREPVSRHTAITLASTSAALLSAHPVPPQAADSALGAYRDEAADLPRS